MKLIATLMFALLLIVASVQGQTITLNEDPVEPGAIRSQISEQSGWGTKIIGDALKGAKKRSYHVINMPLFKFLEEVYCKDQPYTYDTLGHIIILYRRPSPEPVKAMNKPAFYWGRFIDSSGEGVANIMVSYLNEMVDISDSHGRFHIKNARPGDWFTFSGPDIEPGSFMLATNKDFTIKVKVKSKDSSNYTYMQPVIHTGMQLITKKRNVGSSYVVTADVLQQRTTPDLYRRMEFFSPSFLLTVNPYTNTYQAKRAAIGGRSTIYSGADPLIILNGFPFMGRFEDINPDDIETITILRDASATTLWGALSGNCVMVVNTRPAKFNQPLRISFNAYVRTGSGPDAFAKDMLSPVDRFFVDSFLTRNGYYNPLIRNPTHPYVPELALRLKTMTDAELQNLRKLDLRNDLNKYVYRHTLEKHLSLQVMGGKKENAYLFSVGLDHSLPSLEFSKTQRFNGSFNYNTRPVKDLDVSATIATIYNKEHNLGGVPLMPVTYASLTDETGAPAVMSFKRNKFFIDTAGVDANGQKKLRDWEYRPLNEFTRRNHDQIYTDHRLQLGLKYNKFPTFLNGLEASLYTQYEIVGSKENDLIDKNSFYVNDLVNSFTQVNGSSMELPVPVGDILDYSITTQKTLSLRAQLLYVKSIGKSASISVLTGSDRIVTRGTFSSRRIYDYTTDKPEGQSNLNYQTLYRQYYYPISSQYIPYFNDAKRTASNYISWYANANLQIKRKYHAALSVRTDRSNIYGSKTNRRFKPLGSIGAAWDISDEDFYHPRIFELLKVRTSIGISGIPPLGASAVQTLSLAGQNENGDVVADINNPSLPGLKWETVMTYNAGITYSLVKQILEGTVDYYYKKSTDVVGYKTVDPTVGVPGKFDNVASMASHNIDWVLTSRNINRMLRWRTKFIFSYLKEFIIQTDTSLQPAWMYCDQNRFSVVRKRPLYGIYSFPSAGLDEAGDPVAPGKNKDYQSITTSPGPATLHYNGRSTPSIFGSITNQFNWKQFELAFTFSYKLGYYYRQPSVNYSGIFEGTDPGSADFSNRWQKPGDEYRTSVPRLLYPNNPFRDYFYIYSSPLVKRADFIRLHNIHVSYDLERKMLRKLHLRLANFYVNCDNAGIVWRATKSKLDPDNLLGFPAPTVFTFGFKGTLK